MSNRVSNKSNKTRRVSYLLTAAVLVSAAGLFSGCLSQKVKDITYYVLEVSDKGDLSSSRSEEAYPWRVLVEDSRVGEVYDRRELVWRGGGPVIGYFDFHHWGARLTQMASDYIAKALEESGGFSKVYRNYTLEEADYILTPVIDRIEMIKSGENGEPRVRFEIEFLWQTRESLEPVFQWAAVYDREIADEKPATFVNEVGGQLLEGVRGFLEEFSSWRESSGGNQE